MRPTRATRVADDRLNAEDVHRRFASIKPGAVAIQARDESVCILHTTHVRPYRRHERRAAPILVAPREPERLVLIHRADDRHKLGAL